MSIEVSHLCKIYGLQKAVDDISFKINEGEITGFLGPNGAGKSTTMKIITGYLPWNAGMVSVYGLDVKKFPLEIKKKIGYLPEANPLYYDMYVKEYLQFIAGVHSIKKNKEAIKNVIELTGLTVESNKKIGQLSKGFKQRTGLAAALIHHPDVLILDEPTSGLDPNQIIEIRNVIKQQGKNKTVLFSSHILQEVEAICDRIIIINKGKIVADDTILNLHKTKHENVIKISFKENINEDVLKNLPGINEIRKENDSTWKLTSNNVNEARKQLMQLALNENLNITSLQTEGSSLEEIFRSLTLNN